MKVMTVLGTRPEIIRLSLVIPLLDQQVDHVLVHTGQNFDDSLDAVFFRDLGLRSPNVNLSVRGGFGSQVGQILSGVEELLLKHRPERLLLLGDTNSALCAIVARRMGIAVYHMEAGNRCYDDRVPEEVNRRIVDHCSTVLMPYTNRSRENLVREGFAGNRTFTIGNPIKQVIDRFAGSIASSDITARLGLAKGNYFLVTMHRAENVDIATRLQSIVSALEQLYLEYQIPVICSIHPRTASKIRQFKINADTDALRFLEPLSFFDFVHLEQSARCCLSDSGTVQEEACIFGVPNVTIRDVTERPETVECGSNFLAGTETAGILAAVRSVLMSPPSWTPPREYLVPSVAETACRIVTSFMPPDAAHAEWVAAVRS
jgi:UDP-N-acetylglucosamine 2-epimerase (non-hydrolysing)